jgi:hypothetical protein
MDLSASYKARVNPYTLSFSFMNMNGSSSISQKKLTSGLQHRGQQGVALLVEGWNDVLYSPVISILLKEFVSEEELSRS